MARTGGRGDLFISVGGTVEPLKASMKAGQSVLNEFGMAAIDVSAEVGKAFANMSTNAPAEARKLEQAYAKTFAEIRRNAQAVLNAPTQAGAVDVLNAAGARQAAQAAEAEAAALRQLADAAIRADKAAGGTNAGVRLLAISTEAAAREALQHATALRTQAGALDLVEAELVGTAAAHRRVNVVAGQSRAGMQQLGFQLNDVAVQWAQGTRPAIIFAQQISQVTQAVQLMSNGTSKFASFIGGPWGIAVTLGVTVLAPLVSKLFETGDAVDKLIDKMRKQAEEARNQETANAIWKRSIEGVTDAIREQNKERVKAQETPLSKLEDDKKKAEDAGKTATQLIRQLQQRRKEVADAIAETRASIERMQVAPTSAEMESMGSALLAAQAALESKERRLRNIDLLIKQQEKNATDAAANVRSNEAQISKLDIEATLDPAVAATRTLEKAERDLLKQRTDGLITLDEYNKRLTAAKDAYKAAAEAAKELKKGGPDGDLTAFVSPVGGGAITGKFGEKRPGHNHNGVDLAVPVGTNVQAAAAGTVIEVGNLPGYGNVVIIDHGRGTTTRYAHLSKFLATKGQQVGQGDVIALSGGAAGAPGSGNSQGPHVHFEVRRGGKPVDPRKGSFPVDPALAGRGSIRSAESEAEKLVRQQNAFEEQRTRLKEQLLDVEGHLLTGAQAQAEAAAKGIDAEEKRLKQAIQNDLEEGKYGEATSATATARAAELTQIVESVANQKRINLGLQGYLRWLDDQDAAREQLAQFKIDEKEYEQSIARTANERKTLALQILDLVYEEKKRHLEYLKAQAILNGETAEAARIQAELNNLPKEKARDRDAAGRANRSPLDDYFDKLPQSLEEVNEELEKMAANGLDQLGDELGRATAKALGLKGALGDIVGQLVKLAFQFALGALGPSIGFGGARAGGGDIDSRKFYRVGERGEEWFFPGVSGTIVPNHVLKAAMMPSIPRSFSGRAANDDRRGGSWRPTVVNQSWHVTTPDADSFRRNERQMRRDGRRGLGFGAG